MAESETIINGINGLLLNGEINIPAVVEIFRQARMNADEISKNEAKNKKKEEPISISADLLAEALHPLVMQILQDSDLTNPKNYENLYRIFSIAKENDVKSMADYESGLVINMLYAEMPNVQAQQQSVEDKALNQDIQNYNVTPQNYHQGVKKELLDEMMNKLISLKNQGDQPQKTAALYRTYDSFKKLDLTNYQAVKNCKMKLNDNLKPIESFSSRLGRVGAWIKHSLFGTTSFATPMTHTRLLIDKVHNFIEQNALPQYRINR